MRKSLSTTLTAIASALLAVAVILLLTGCTVVRYTPPEPDTPAPKDINELEDIHLHIISKGWERTDEEAREAICDYGAAAGIDALVDAWQKSSNLGFHDSTVRYFFMYTCDL